MNAVAAELKVLAAGLNADADGLNAEAEAFKILYENGQSYSN